MDKKETFMREAISNTDPFDFYVFQSDFVGALGMLPRFLQDPNQWTGLRVTYEKPEVRRLWIQWGTKRLFLHEIQPCSSGEPLVYPHPWPSMVYLVEGTQEMLIGQGEPDGPVPSVLTRLLLSAGSSYEMLDSKEWHSVRPLQKPSLSVMITGTPYPTPQGFRPGDQGKGKSEPLPDGDKERLLSAFQRYF